jgi:hypothetical protein
VDVAEVAAESEHPVGRFEDLEHRVASRVGPVDDRAAEHSILAKQLGSAGDLARFDGGAEAVREHQGGGYRRRTGARARLSRTIKRHSEPSWIPRRPSHKSAEL